ncbi:MAG: radical SAM protein [Chloroflexota bacterium]
MPSVADPVIHPPIAGGLTTTAERYDIEADWSLMSTCNYRCEYCFWDSEALGRKIKPPAPIDTLSRFFDDTSLTWLLHLTGGEPFHYPRFVELCRLLTQRHFISINTNADSDRVRTFSEIIDPARVDFINCGVHVQQREERNRAEAFVRNVHFLRDAGFDAFASCVMYPPVFPDFSETWERYAQDDVILIPKAFRGIYQGRPYPEAYSDSQRALFIEYSLRAEQECREQITRRAVRPSIDPFLDRERFLHGTEDCRGRMCRAGRDFVRIWDTGEIRRCGPADVIGNVAEGWFHRRNGPSPCIETECPYFCARYLVQGPLGARLRLVQIGSLLRSARR